MVTFDDARKFALSLPAVEEGTSYGTVAFRVKKKYMFRLREDGETLALRVPFDARDMLMESRPEVFFITDHYRGYPAVLLRLATASRKELEGVVRMSWKFAAPKRLASLYKE